MGLALALLAGFGLWWFSKHGARLDPKLTARLARRVGAWGAVGLAAILLLRGQLGPALILGLGGVWLLEGPERLGTRLKRLFTRRTAGRRYRSALIELEMWPDGRIGDATVIGGAGAGQRLDALGKRDVLALRQLCRVQDPDGVALLEAYLDRRHPGWRVDAERDGDAGPRRPPQPGAMTQDEAYQVLGLERGATPEAVRTAHRTLMKQAHPDQGGSAERAARVNAARDRLTNRHR